MLVKRARDIGSVKPVTDNCDIRVFTVPSISGLDGSSLFVKSANTKCSVVPVSRIPEETNRDMKELSFNADVGAFVELTGDEIPKRELAEVGYLLSSPTLEVAISLLCPSQTVTRQLITRTQGNWKMAELPSKDDRAL